MANKTWKKYDNVWKYNKHDFINYSLYSEFKEEFTTPNKAYLYMPVHNVNDIYEWYRIFYDAFYFKDPQAKNYIDNIGHGIGITMYTNKDRAKTIKAWYPNLVEVKASSANTLKYVYDGINYSRSSVDYITNFNIGVDTNLLIDNTLIHPTEKVLLKNQFNETLNFFEIDQLPGISGITTINNIDKIITIYVDSTVVTKYNTIIRENGTLVCINADNSYTELLVESLSITDANPLTTYEFFITIQLPSNAELGNVVKVADKINGEYTPDNSLLNQNGIYEYDGINLILIDEMNIPEKVYNQLVYTYQGETNQNNVYYLRRHEEKFHQYYTHYPCTNYNLPMIYSLGNPYLIECEVNYDIAMKPADFDNVGLECTAYNANFNYLDHPDHDGPYTYNDNIFRLLYTDYDLARKLQMKSNIGPADFMIDVPFILMDIDTDYYAKEIFLPISSETNNYLNKYRTYKNFNSMNEIVFTTYDPFELDVNNVPNPIDPLITNKGIFNADSINYTIVSNEINEFEFNTYLIDPNTETKVNDTESTISINSGLVNFKIDVYDNGTKINALNETVYALNINKVGSTLTIEFENSLNINVINDLFENYKEGGVLLPNIEYDIEIDFITLFPFVDGTIISTNPNTPNSIDPIRYISYTRELIKAFNKTIIGQVYDLGYSIGTSTVLIPQYDNIGNPILDEFSNPALFNIDLIETVALNLNKLRNNFNLYIYSDMEQELITNIGTSFIQPNFKNVYDPNYTLENYLCNYLSYDPNHQFLTRESNSIALLGDSSDPDYFIVLESAKQDNHGTIIKYGINYKQYILENLKPNSFCKITDDDGFINNNWNYTFIISNEFDYETNIGTLVINSLVHGLEFTIFPNSTVYFDPTYTLTEISDKLKETFDITNNIGNNVDISLPGISNYYPMKPSTYSIGNDIVNNRDVFKDITGVVYKEFNEPVYTFLKRDKKFRFNEDPIITTDAIIIDPVGFIEHDGTLGIDAEIDVMNADSYSLNIGDTVLLVNQTLPKHNGIFEVVSFSGTNTNLKKLDLSNNIYYKADNGSLANTLFYSYFDSPYAMYSTDIYLFQTEYRKKSDPRLNISFTQYAKLGVDNEYQPFKDINHNRDSIEVIENLVSVASGINVYNAIRFVDGLSYDNIINNYNGMGQFAWILHENVITENAVVGKMIDPIDNIEKLVWYTGKWIDGVWCNGIWIQGIWENGIWVNGRRYSYGIIDNISQVIIDYSTIIDTLSIWKNGRWINGTNYNGIMEFVFWENGTFEGGLIIDGIWNNGTFNGTIDLVYTLTIGRINHLIWHNGIFNAGVFETGIFYNGTFNGGIFGENAHLSLLYRDRAIFVNGVVNGGTFMTANGLNHNATIIYSGRFKGILNSGTIVIADINAATINNGVIIGGYYCNNTIYNELPLDKRTELYFDPTQWDNMLGLTNLLGYIPNISHNILPYISTLAVIGNPSTTPLSEEFVNDRYRTIFTTNPALSLDASLDFNVSTLNFGTDYIELNMGITNGYTYNTDKDRPFITTSINDHNTNINGGIFIKKLIYGTPSNRININNAMLFEIFADKCNIQ